MPECILGGFHTLRVGMSICVCRLCPLYVVHSWCFVYSMGFCYNSRHDPPFPPLLRVIDKCDHCKIIQSITHPPLSLLFLHFYHPPPNSSITQLMTRNEWREVFVFVHRTKTLTPSRLPFCIPDFRQNYMYEAPLVLAKHLFFLLLLTVSPGGESNSLGVSRIRSEKRRKPVDALLGNNGRICG